MEEANGIADLRGVNGALGAAAGTRGARVAPGRRPRAHSLPALTFVVGACFTASVYLLPGDMLDVAYRSVSLRVAYETFGALAGLAFAYFIVGRGRGSPRLSDCLIAGALLVAAVENVVFLAIPTAHDYGYTSRFAAWSSSSARIVEAALFVAATFTSGRVTRVSRGRAVAATVAATGAICTVIALAVLAAGRHLPAAISQSLSPVSGRTALPAGAGSIALLALVASLLFGFAAARLAVATRADDPLGRWLAVGLVAACLAAVNFAVFPTEYSPWVDAGDILEFAFSIALLAGIAGEVRHYWQRLVGAAVLEERRRIARDLHDGVAQELAFIVLEAEGAAGSPAAPDTLQRIAASAERARMEVRLAVAAFMEPLDSSVLSSVERTARDVARGPTAVRVETTGKDFEATSAERDALHWITREAVANAIRHGHARTVRLRSTPLPARRYRVVDDGDGFDGAGSRSGFGITIMSERAARAGGSLYVRSVRGVGTGVEVVFPSARPASHAGESPARPGRRRR